eukprot:5804364-Pleurochrysis_carterae.AAC.2
MTRRNEGQRARGAGRRGGQPLAGRSNHKRPVWPLKSLLLLRSSALTLHKAESLKRAGTRKIYYGYLLVRSIQQA